MVRFPVLYRLIGAIILLGNGSGSVYSLSTTTAWDSVKSGSLNIQIMDKKICTSTSELRSALMVGGNVLGCGTHRIPEADPLQIIDGHRLVFAANESCKLSGPSFLMYLGDQVENNEGFDQKISQEASKPDFRNPSSITRIDMERLHTDLRAARDHSLTCLDAFGGQWHLQECNVRSEGGVGVRIVGASQMEFHTCSIGGVGDGPRRAGMGMAAYQNSSAGLHSCEVSSCLAGVVATNSAKMRTYDCKVFDVSYAAMLDEAANIVMIGCRMMQVKQGLLSAGNTAGKASIELIDNDVQARLWFGANRPRNVMIDESNSIVEPAERVSPLQSYEARPPVPRIVPGLDARPVDERPGWVYKR